MKALHQALRSAFFYPILPSSLKRVAGFLRSTGYLPREQAASGAINRVLVVQPHNSLGDLVLSIPFLAEIHRLWPHAEIDVVVGNAMTEIFENISFLNRVIPYTPSKLRQPFRRYHDTVRLAQLAHRSLKGPYDLALDPRWDSDVFAYLARVGCFFSGAAQRGAYSGAVDERDPSLDSFLTKEANGGSHEHELLRKLRLFERLGLSSRHLEDQEQLQTCEALCQLAESRTDRALPLLQAAGLQPGERYGVLAPSASTANRIWPVELLSDVIRALWKKTGLRFFAVGSAQDAKRCAHLAALNPRIVTSLAGQTGILQLSAILRDAMIFIGNDSGPAHISGLLGRNTVIVSPYPAALNGIDHMNAPSRFRPCGPRVRVVQPQQTLAPCKDYCSSREAHCVTQVSVQQVLMDSLLLIQLAESREQDLAERLRNGL